MSLILQYFAAKPIPVMITTLSNFIINAAILLETFHLSRTKVPITRFLLSNFIISATQFLPLWIFSALFYFPGELDMAAYSALVYPTPLSLILYYWIYRTILRFPKDMSLIFMEWVLLTQYVAMLAYQTMNAVWTTVLTANKGFLGMYNADIPALISSMFAAWIIRFALKAVVSKTGYYLEMPSDYPFERIAKTVPSTCLMSAINYLMVVFGSIVLVIQRRPNTSADLIWIYALMLVIQAYRLLDQYRTKRLHVLEWQAEATQRYTETLMRTLESFRALKHDFGNIIQIYGGYISTRDYDGLTQYHNSMTNVVHDVGDDMSLVESLSQRTALYYLFSIKLKLARDLDILCDVMGVGALSDAAINDLDLCRILGNLLDNAIDAAQQSDARSISISVRREKPSRVFFTIANSIGSKPDIARIFEVGYTTKEEHMGHGLSSVKRILASRNFGTLNIDCTDAMFTVQLSLGTRR